MPATAAPALDPELSIPFLAGLRPEERQAVLNAAREKELKAGQIIFHEGHRSTHACLLTAGRAKYLLTSPSGEALVLHWITPGEIAGLMAMLRQPLPYAASTQIAKDGRGLFWEREAILELSQRYARLLENALSISVEYLLKLAALHLSSVTFSAQQRLADCLLDLGERIGHSGPEGTEIEVTNEHLADMVGINVFTTSRFMSHWQRDGVIAKSRGKVTLRRPEELAG